MLLFLVIIAFQIINDQSVITAVFIAAGYTYGPLLGLFSFGLLNKKETPRSARTFNLYCEPLALLRYQCEFRNTVVGLQIWL